MKIKGGLASFDMRTLCAAQDKLRRGGAERSTPPPQGHTYPTIQEKNE